LYLRKNSCTGKSAARIQIKEIIGGQTASTPIEIERKRLEDFINTKRVPLVKNKPIHSKQPSLKISFRKKNEKYHAAV
jgi:hypothetical protein